MVKIAPLKRYPLFISNNIEEAEVAICKSISDVTIMRVEHPARFQIKMAGVDLGQASLVYNFFGDNTKLKAGQPEDYVYLVLSGERPTSFQLGKDNITISPKLGAVIIPERLTYIERSSNSEILALRFPKSDILQHFEELTGRHHSGSLCFQQSVDLSSGNGAMVNRMLDYVIQELNYDDLMLSHPGYARSLGQMLLSAIIALPHSKSAHLKSKRSTSTAPGIVRRAEEYMKANLSEPISIIDLLQISDCSRSVLFSSFQNTRSYTPMEFLTEQRLQHARQNLLHPEETDTVSSIAVHSGFVNFGRFAQIYNKRFGELPSRTLGKSKRN